MPVSSINQSFFLKIAVQSLVCLLVFIPPRRGALHLDLLATDFQASFTLAQNAPGA
jgi:hypothetical protein